MTKYHTPKYNIPSNINKQTNKQLYHARPCKTKVHIWSPLWETCPSKKDIRVPFRAPLFLGKWYGVVTYFSLYKKIRKNTNYKIHWLNSFIHWLNKNYISERKLKSYIALGPSYNLPNIHMACCPSYILPKTDRKSVV